MIYLLTAVGQTPSGSSTIQIYTQTIHRTTQSTKTIHRTTQFTNQEECRPCPVFASYTLTFALQLRKKHGKSSALYAPYLYCYWRYELELRSRKEQNELDKCTVRNVTSGKDMRRLTTFRSTMYRIYVRQPGSGGTPLPGYLTVTSWVYHTTSCNTQSSAPEDGRDRRPKHVELIGIFNKPLLLHLVGCLCYLYQ